MFSVLSNTEIIILSTSDFLLANAFSVDQAKILPFDEELTFYHTIPTFNDPK